MISTTQTDFPEAVKAVEEQDAEQLDKLESIARSAQADGRRLARALKAKDSQAVEEALWYLSSTGSVVNSWTGK